MIWLVLHRHCLDGQWCFPRLYYITDCVKLPLNSCIYSLKCKNVCDFTLSLNVTLLVLHFLLITVSKCIFKRFLWLWRWMREENVKEELPWSDLNIFWIQMSQKRQPLNPSKVPCKTGKTGKQDNTMHFCNNQKTHHRAESFLQLMTYCPLQTETRWCPSCLHQNLITLSSITPWLKNLFLCHIF